MDESKFSIATNTDRERYIVRPCSEIPLTELVPGCASHLLSGENMLASFLTMNAGSTFELHSHPEEQIMIVTEGYCDEVVGNKIYHLREGDVIYLPPNIKHGAFIRDVDCKAIDVFSPVRPDYKKKYVLQNPGSAIKFKP